MDFSFCTKASKGPKLLGHWHYTKRIGRKWPNHNLIGSLFIPANRSKNAKDITKLIKSSIDPSDISVHNLLLSNWITTDLSKIQNLSSQTTTRLSWQEFKKDPRCWMFRLDNNCFNLLSDATIESLDTLMENIPQPIDVTSYKSHITSWLRNGSSQNTLWFNRLPLFLWHGCQF